LVTTKWDPQGNPCGDDVIKEGGDRMAYKKLKLKAKNAFLTLFFFTLNAVMLLIIILIIFLEVNISIASSLKKILRKIIKK